MQSITLTATTAQVSRIRDALRNLETGQLASDTDIRDWLMRQLKARVLQNELGKASQASEEVKRAELVSEGW